MWYKEAIFWVKMKLVQAERSTNNSTYNIAPAQTLVSIKWVLRKTT